MLRRGLIFSLLLALILGGFGFAQRLADLLPAETILAFGLEDLNGVSAQLEDFRAEFERLDLAGALSTIFADAEQGQDLSQSLDELSAQLGDLTFFDLLGQEAWISVSASAFNPLPAVTLITRLSPDSVPLIKTLLRNPPDDMAAELQTFNEGDFTFYQVPLEGADMPVQFLAYAEANGLLMLSSNPDTLRGILRRTGGSSEPGFAAANGYSGTLGRFEPGNFYSYIDYAQIAAVIKPFTQGLGFDGLVDRLIKAFDTAGASGGVARITNSGMVSKSFQAVNPQGGDFVLYNLLTDTAPADRSTVRFAPVTSLSYGSSYADLRGWWDYLNDLALSMPELGGDLDSLILSFTGIDLRSGLFDWTDSQFSTVVTGLSEVVEPGMPSDNFLGEQVYLIATRDEIAARDGLGQLLQSISQSFAGFSDPFSDGGGETLIEPVASVEEIAGITVTHYNITDGVSLSYAISDGYVLLATSREAMRKSLESDATLADQISYRSLIEQVPGNANTFSFSDSRATMEATALQLSSQFRLMAGFGGSANLDFDAVMRATNALEEFLLFVALRLGSSIGYSERSPEGIYLNNETEVSW